MSLNDNHENPKSDCIYTYNNSKYPSQMLTEMRNLYNSKKLTDVRLICNNQKSSNSSESSDDTSKIEQSISCHKIILASFSPYFQAMFSSDLLESKTNIVKLDSTDYQTLKDIIDYAYTGTIDLNINNVQNIFTLASLLQVKDLIDACCDYIESQLDASNVIEIYTFSNMHMCEYLSNRSKEFLNRNFVDISDTIEFIEIEDAHLINEILASDEIDTPTEEFLVEKLMKWIFHNYELRKTHFEYLFTSTIRLSLIDSSFLIEFKQSYRDLLEDNPKCLSLVNDYIEFNRMHSINIQENSDKPAQKYSQQISARNNLLKINEKRRAGMTKAQHSFILLGGNCDLDDGFYINCFNPFNGEKYYLSRNYLEKSKLLCKGYFHVENPGVCVTHDNRIFIAGGNHIYHEYKIYNNKTGGRKSANSASLTRNTNSQRQTNSENPSSFDEIEHLKDGEELLSKEVYEYDNSRDIWIRRASMLFAKANFSLCAMKNTIYSFGGLTNDGINDIVEYYDIEENKWTYVGSMPSPFVAGCVVAHDNLFYIIGGRNGVGRHDNCYVFNPSNREWHEISPMKIGRFNFGACVINSKIYVFGGQRYITNEQNYFTREALESVEVFDLVTREWSIGDSIPSPLYNTGVCVFDNEDSNCIYICGTTECKYSGTTLFGFIFTSVFRLEFSKDVNNDTKLKWTVVEHDVSDIKSNYRCVAAKINTRKLHKCQTTLELREKLKNNSP